MTPVEALIWIRIIGELVALIEKIFAGINGVTPAEMEAALRGANEALVKWQDLRKDTTDG